MVREVVTDESPWTDSDRWLALALDLHERSLCPGGCGHYRDEAWHPDSEGWYEAHGTQCWACDAIRQAAEKHDPGPQVHVYASDERPASHWPLAPNVPPVDAFAK